MKWDKKVKLHVPKYTEFERIQFWHRKMFTKLNSARKKMTTDQSNSGNALRLASAFKTRKLEAKFCWARSTSHQPAPQYHFRMSSHFPAFVSTTFLRSIKSNLVKNDWFSNRILKMCFLFFFLFSINYTLQPHGCTITIKSIFLNELSNDCSKTS